jgi:hypothetical protein
MSDNKLDVGSLFGSGGDYSPDTKANFIGTSGPRASDAPMAGLIGWDGKQAPDTPMAPCIGSAEQPANPPRRTGALSNYLNGAQFDPAYLAWFRDLQNEKDKFGLPKNYALFGIEGALNREARIAQVNSLIAEVFSVAEAHLGHEEAVKAWNGASKRDPGRPKGSGNQEREASLLQLYDYFAAQIPPNELPQLASVMAIKLSKQEEFRSCQPDSIAHAIRRAIKARKQRGKAPDAQAGVASRSGRRADNIWPCPGPWCSSGG